MNLILPMLTDSYKVTHWKQTPPGLQRVQSYFEARYGKFAESVPVGLQYQLQRYFKGSVVQHKDIAQAQRLLTPHFGGVDHVNVDGWRHLVDDHNGRLPLHIKSIPEGTPVPVGNVLMTVDNTCDVCYWLPNYLETLLVQNWYGQAVASLSREIKKILLASLIRTGDPRKLPWKLHDFGFRGASSIESAAIGGTGHLAIFRGTDTLVALQLIDDHYGDAAAGDSIPAAEHFTITAWGELYEREAFANMLDQFPTGPVAIVSDTYDIEHAVRVHFGKSLRERILARDGVVIVRPDSGDPPEMVNDVQAGLAEAYGYERNAKGFKELDPHIAVIQGDGNNLPIIGEVIRHNELKQWSTNNYGFGMGGGLLQQVNRDEPFSSAFKANWVQKNGVGYDIYKRPKSDPRKNSKRGRLALVWRDGRMQTVREDEAHGENLLQTTFLNGEVIGPTTFRAVRERAALDVPVEV